MVALADLMVWVVDPQKYADGVLHERYLRPLCRLRRRDGGRCSTRPTGSAPEARAACVADLGRLLAADGLAGVPVLAVSAATGDGLDALRDELERRVAAREAAVARLAADVDAFAAPLATACGTGRAGKIGRDERARAGRGAQRRRGRPVDRARRGRLAPPRGRPGHGLAVRALAAPRRVPTPAAPAPARRHARRTELPGGHPLLPARGDAGAARAGRGGGARRSPRARPATCPDPWPRLVRGAALANEDALTDALEAAVAGTDLRPRRPRWWRLAGVLQLVLAAADARGRAVAAGAGRPRLPQLEDAVPTPEYEGFPIPTLLAGGGALAGLLWASWPGSSCAPAPAAAAGPPRGRCARRVERVGEEHILAPVASELDAHARLCEAVGRAQAGRPRRIRSLVTNSRRSAARSTRCVEQRASLHRMTRAERTRTWSG